MLAAIELYACTPSVMQTTNARTMSSGCQLKRAAVLLLGAPPALVVSTGPNAKPPKYPYIAEALKSQAPGVAGARTQRS